MRQSNYGIYHETTSGGCYYINTMTNALIKFNSKEEYNRAKNATNEAANENSDYINKLMKMGIICNSSKNEHDRLRYRELMAQYGSNEMALTIMPTLDCNLRCIYCYEEHINKYMKNNTIEKILNYVENNAYKWKRLAISWYGGEPTLAMDTVRKLNKGLQSICAKNNCELYSVMTTNGYEFSDSTTKVILEELKLKRILISLDGTEEVHNSRRPHSTGKGTFRQIVQNIENLCAASTDLNVRIRVNIDRNNYKNIIRMLDELSPIIKSKVSYDFEFTAMLSQVPEEYRDSMILPQKFSEAYNNVQDFYVRNSEDITKQKFALDPRVRWGTRCGVENIDSYVIGPDGEVYKCGAQLASDQIIGELDENGNITVKQDKLSKWLEDSYYETGKSCQNCLMRPLCHGGCKARKYIGEDYCLHLKSNYRNYIEWYLSNVIEKNV